MGKFKVGDKAKYIGSRLHKQKGKWVRVVDEDEIDIFSLKLKALQR